MSEEVQHLVGEAILRLGLMHPRDVFHALRTISSMVRQGHPSTAELWVEHGFLDPAQFSQVMLELGVGIEEVSEAAGGVSLDEETERVGDKETSVDIVAEPRRDALFEDTKTFVKDQTRRFATRDDPEADTSQLAFQKTAFHTVPLKPADPDGEEDQARYIMGAELGSGGGGRVVRAFDRRLGRTVAMKILRSDAHQNLDARNRFVAEAQATGQLEHPHIIPIYDLGSLESGEPFYTMREVRKHSLREILLKLAEDDRETSSEYDLNRRVEVLRLACQAVHYAHVRGVVHRDLKPDNIMVGDYGEVLVMDWGLARILENRPVKTTMDQKLREPGQTFGTPAYMPPEQAEGLIDEIDERSDLYSLCAILYEVLTLSPPFVGDGPLEVMHRVVHDEVVPPSRRCPELDIPVELEKIAMKGLSRKKSDRYASVRQLYEELDDWSKGVRPRKARAALDEALASVSAWKTHRQTASELEEKVHDIAQKVQPWEPVDAKRALWKHQDQLHAELVDAARHFGHAVTYFHRALALQPDDPQILASLAELYWLRYLQAEDEGALADQFYFEALVRQYDDGEFTSRIEGTGNLTIEGSTEFSLDLYRFQETDLRLVASDAEKLAPPPLTLEDLPMGSYLVAGQKAGAITVRQPVVIGRDTTVAVALPDIPEAGQADGFVMVPSGPFVCGGDPQAFDAQPAMVRDLDAFFCAVYPVTFREYLAWIEELQQELSAEELLPRIPQTRGSDGLLCTFEEGKWIPGEILIEGPARKMYPAGQGFEWDLPVVGIRTVDAQDFAAYRSKKDGRTYRLPTQWELEKAGRGVDGRHFPWGNRFDATFCKMRFSRPELPQLEPVGVFVDDLSPYGVRDLAGGVQEWCAAENKVSADRPIRGGGWNQDARACRLASRFKVLAAARSAGIGMRLVYDA